MMVPVIGLLQIGVGNGADRFTYLPQIGLAMAMVGPRRTPVGTGADFTLWGPSPPAAAW